MKWMGLLRTHWLIAAYLIAYTAIFGFKIWMHPFPFFDWDESIYAQVGREMMRAGSYAIPLWQGEYWLDKPPLVPLFYGIVMAVTPMIPPETATRLATLGLSVVALGLMYLLYFRVVKEVWFATSVVVITSLTSIFLQRAQVLNVDIFLLIGWLGYLLFFQHRVRATLFLGLAVYSKSMIGFYPMGIILLFYVYRVIRKEITFAHLLRILQTMLIQAGILLSWHGVMTVMFGGDFLYKHFYESHVKRVTASIESHFGARTFYITLLWDSYGMPIFVAIAGFGLLIYQWLRKKISDRTLLYSLFFVPWFLFLNLTKTKIFWYGHPYLGQFAFLMLYPAILLRRYGLLYYPLLLAVVVNVLFFHLVTHPVTDDFYSSENDHHRIAQTAKTRCDRLAVVIPPEGRVAYETLRSMNLLISTSTWWGNHPSMVYYFDGPVEFVYEGSRIDQLRVDTSTCVATSPQDGERFAHRTHIQSLPAMQLYE